MATYKNPEEKKINQSQGPRSGNAGNTEKRNSFLKEKTTGFREQLADFVMSALEKRDPKDYIDPRVEPLDADRGPKSNPTAGGTKYNVKGKRPGKITK
jgi:hypothetical protein